MNLYYKTTMFMRLRSIAQLFFGIATFIPGVYKLRSKKNGSGGSYSARYCYSVYLRHMVMAKKSNFSVLKTDATLKLNKAHITAP